MIRWWNDNDADGNPKYRGSIFQIFKRIVGSLKRTTKPVFGGCANDKRDNK